MSILQYFRLYPTPWVFAPQYSRFYIAPISVIPYLCDDLLLQCDAGLVYNLTEYLSSHGINIESLETYTQEVSPGSPPLFMMEGVIAMPVGLSTATFIHNLDTLQATLGAEISITELLNPVRKLAPSSLEESS